MATFRVCASSERKLIAHPSSSLQYPHSLEVDRASRGLRLQRLKVSDREDPFGAVVRCTADPVKADKRTRSKWSRVMRYAAAYKPNSEPLNHFIRRKGGINGCAARFSRCIGRRKTWGQRLTRRSVPEGISSG
jgi:hypothetical protein